MIKYTYLLFSLLSFNLVCYEPSKAPSKTYNFEERKAILPTEENNVAEQAHKICAQHTMEQPIPFELIFPETHLDVTGEDTVSECPDLEKRYSSAPFQHPTEPQITAATNALRLNLFKKQPTGEKISLVTLINGSEISFLFKLARSNGAAFYAKTCGALMQADAEKAFLLISTLSRNPNGNMNTETKLLPIVLKKQH